VDLRGLARSVCEFQNLPNPLLALVKVPDEMASTMPVKSKSPSQSPVKVLLVGDHARNASVFQGYLRRRGCNIFFAASCQVACGMLREHHYDLVLSDFMLSDGTAYQLMPHLRGTDTTMFFSFAVEEGCWWMNAMYDGQDRSDEPGMRTPQFKIILDGLLFEKHLRNAEERGGEPSADGSRYLAVQVRDK
jgi:CheY-like chemotaxis protein